MEKAVDAFGQEIKLGQVIVYASAQHYAMKMVSEWDCAGSLVSAQFNPALFRKSLLISLISVEMKYGQALCDLDPLERTNKSETYIGVD